MSHLIFDAAVILTSLAGSWALARVRRQPPPAPKVEPIIYSVGQTVLVQPDVRENFWFEAVVVEMGNHQYKVGEFKVFSVLVRHGDAITGKEWWLPVAQVRPLPPEPDLDRVLAPERRSPFRD
jgi:hypothetical protein